MLNVFPSLLTYTLFATTAIRVLVGLVLFYFGVLLVSKKKVVFTEKLTLHGYPLVKFMPWVFGIILILAGGFLIVGFLTQVAAIVAAYSFINLSVIDSGEIKILNQSCLLYVVMIILSLSLLVSGPGLFAFDLPL